MRIGVTGANGFVGGHLGRALKAAAHEVRALVRAPGGLDVQAFDEIVAIPTIDADTDVEILRAAMTGLDAIVHLAAKVHVMNADLDDAAFNSVNVDGSDRVYSAATAAGVKRFVFLSSVKAAGERSGDTPLTPETATGPEDAYGRSKLEAENRLRERARHNACALVILRPAFVYGTPATGNFKAVISAILRGLPLPLAGLNNRRDMTYVGNLADAIVAACTTKKLDDTPYFISDGNAVSTPELFRRTAHALGRKARLFYAPLWLLRVAGAVTGRSAAVARISENFIVDTEPFRRDADWQPPYKMSDGLSAVAQALQDANRVGMGGP